jgi:hypothetical protein
MGQCWLTGIGGAQRLMRRYAVRRNDDTAALVVLPRGGSSDLGPSWSGIPVDPRTSIELTMVEAFSQLSSVSAVLGGFALAFPGVVISVAERSRAREIAAALALICSGGLVLCALDWSLAAVWLSSLVASTDLKSTPPAALISVHTQLSPLFLLCVCLFFWTLGASGWIYSKRLGILSTALAILATGGAYAVVSPFLITG